MNHIGLHNTKVYGIIRLLICLVMTITLSTGCGSSASSPPADPGVLQLYYITPDIDGVVSVNSDIDITGQVDPATVLKSVTEALKTVPVGSGYHAPLDGNNGFISAVINENQALFDFGDEYSGLDRIESTLIRAAVTRSVTQISGIDSVIFTVKGQQLLDDNGMTVGALSADMFIDNAGLTINPDERTQLTLYFANKSGDRLVKVSRMVVYSGNISMDKLVMNQLLLGPQEGEDAYPVMNPETKAINVTTQDGTCYVNLDDSFLAPLYNVSNDVAIYSIVNSLSELGNVNRVQFLIDSDSDALFRETVSLNTQFVRNLDIVEE